MNWLYSSAKRAILIQLGFAIILLSISFIFFLNTKANLANEGIFLGFGFLSGEAGFDVNESLIQYSASDSYARVLLVGLLNTLELAFFCIIGSTTIGVCMGILRAGNNFLGKNLSLVYIECMRNLPKLLILLAIFIALVNKLPHVKQAWSFLDLFFVSNRAIYYSVINWSSATQITLAGWLLWAVLCFFYKKRVNRIQDLTGFRKPFFIPAILGFILIPLIPTIFGINYEVSIPMLKGFDYRGGGRFSIQFVTLALTLSIYHGGQIAELVRGGIQSVPKGQIEAAKALNLPESTIMMKITMPQAMRMIVPPLGNQYLNLIKNTSIALAIGYSDLVSVMSTSINQTFRPIELMAVVMTIYLAISLITTALLNWFNRSTRIIER